MSQVTLDNLTEYEARALLMFVEVQNEGALCHSPEKISAVPEKTGDDFYTLVIDSPDGFPADLFETELSGVRSIGYSLLDPEKQPVNTARQTLPELNL